MLYFLTLCFLYSFLGFLLEVAYSRLLRQPSQGKKSLLFLPLCPVYGLGAAAILHMPAPLLSHPLLVFVAGGLLATLIEYAAGLFYLAVGGVRFWDYTNQPCNISGLICPLYTFFWGILALVVVYGLDPLLAPLLAQLPAALILGLYLAFLADALFSLWLLHRTGSKEALRWYM